MVHRYLGNLSVSFDFDGNLVAWSGNPILLTATSPKDTDIETGVTDLYNTLDFSPVVGTTQSAISNVPEETTASSESQLGSLACNALLWEVSTSGAGDAKQRPSWESQLGSFTACLISDALLAGSIPAGDITLDSLRSAIPGYNYLVVKRLTGSQLLGALSRSVTGQLMQVRALWSLSPSAVAPGARALSVEHSGVHREG